MTWTVNDQKFAAVLRLSESQRYEYMVKRVADWEQIWSLATDEGWVLAGDDEGREYVPVWPHARFAAACASDDWHDAVPRSIELSAWLDAWTSGMARDNRMVAVFPTPDVKGAAMHPEQFRSDLQAELSLYE